MTLKGREGRPQAGQAALKVFDRQLFHPIGFAYLRPPAVAFSPATKSGTQLVFHKYLQ